MRASEEANKSQEKLIKTVTKGIALDNDNIRRVKAFAGLRNEQIYRRRINLFFFLSHHSATSSTTAVTLPRGRKEEEKGEGD